MSAVTAEQTTRNPPGTYQIEIRNLRGGVIDTCEHEHATIIGALDKCGARLAGRHQRDRTVAVVARCDGAQLTAAEEATIAAW